MNTRNNGGSYAVAGRADNADRAERHRTFLKMSRAVTGVTCDALAAVGHVGSLNGIMFSDLDDGAVGDSETPALRQPNSRPDNIGLYGMLAVGDIKPPYAHCRPQDQMAPRLNP